jgi:hypothetical protein
MNDLMESGKYKVRVDGYGMYRDERGEHHPMAMVDFTVVGMYDAEGNLQECPKVQRFYRQVLTENTAQWLFSNLKSFGFTGKNLADFDPQSPNADNLYGRLVDATCTIKPGYNNGNPTEEWFPVPYRARLDRAELDRLQAQYSDDFDKAFARPAYQSAEAARAAHPEQPAAPNGAAPPRKPRRGKGVVADVGHAGTETVETSGAKPSGAPLVDADADDSIPF